MSSVIQILIVEDEAYNRRLLQDMIARLRPDWQVVAGFESVKGTVAWMQKNPHPQLLFMDIQLADGLCFAIFEQVQTESMVIFTTAYDDYAIQAFKVNSVDYLLKPFRESELETAIVKFEKLYPSIRQEPRPDYQDIVDAIRKGTRKYRNRMLVSKGPAFIKLELEDVAYFVNENRITTAVTVGNEHHIVDFTLDALEEQLDPEKFFRANRQLVVHIQAVQRIENHFGGKLAIRLHPPFEGDAMVSRLKAMAFKSWVGR